jgi:DNA-binding CsgD family transcriptional regulator
MKRGGGKALTTRQRRAAKLVAEGHSAAEVSAQVGASVSQVRSWRAHNSAFKRRVAELRIKPGESSLAAMLLPLRGEEISERLKEAKATREKEVSDATLPPREIEETGTGERDLTDQQLIAIELILAGRRQSDVAEQLGISRQTLWRWRSEPAFINELARCREERVTGMRERVTHLADLAFDVVEDQLAEGNPQMAIDYLRVLTRRSSSATDVVPLSTTLSVEQSSMELTSEDQEDSAAEPIEGQVNQAQEAVRDGSTSRQNEE